MKKYWKGWPLGATPEAWYYSVHWVNEFFYGSILIKKKDLLGATPGGWKSWVDERSEILVILWSLDTAI